LNVYVAAGFLFRTDLFNFNLQHFTTVSKNELNYNLPSYKRLFYLNRCNY